MTTQLLLNSMSLPPPSALEFDLLDRNRRVGWVNGGTIGLRGFANETEAAHAAWVAHRTLSRRLARRHGGRPAPIDIEPLALARDGDREAIVASTRPFAYLVRPGADSPSGADSFGFEIHVPLPPDELTMRSIAYRIYRTLRKSGIRWAMWDERRAAAAHRAAERAQPVRVPARHPVKESPSAIGFVSNLILTAIAIVTGAGVIAMAPPTVTVPIGIVFAAGLVASGVVATLERWGVARSSRQTTPRSAAGRANVTALTGGNRLRGRDLSDEEMRTFGWFALGAVSLAVLALAVVVPTELGIALAAIGFAGLLVFRLTAAWAGWVPRDLAYTDSRRRTGDSARRTL